MHGIEPDEIKEWGIPVDQKFFRPYDRESLGRKFDLNKERFTILLMTGSFGTGPLEKIVKFLYKDVQVLVICANNKRLYSSLKNAALPNVKVFGFIDNVEELMAISDVIITKPDGVSIAEILAIGLIPIFISVIPGQEIVNAEALQEYGVGLIPKQIEDIRGIILDLRDNPDKLREIKNNIKKIRKTDTLREIYNVIC